MKNYTLQALDEGNITFLKLDKTAANQKWDFVMGLVFCLSALVLGYLAIVLMAGQSGVLHLS